MFCRNCGAEIKPGQKFCEYCGSKIEEPQKKESGFSSDAGRPVPGYEGSDDEDEKKNETGAVSGAGWSNNNSTTKNNTKTYPSNSFDMNKPYEFKEPAAPKTGKKKGSSCCLISAIVGILAFVAFMTFIIVAVVIGKNIVEDWTDSDGPNQGMTTLVPTATTQPTKTPASTNNVISTALFSNSAVRNPLVTLKGNGQDQVTVMVYMNGSDLESDDKEATTDLAEMIKAGSSDKVNVVVQTMGTKKWHNYGISNKATQIHEVTDKGLNTVKTLKQLDCTEEKTLSDFIIWSAQNYPADRYILVFWDHGGGPVYGFGYDQYNEEGMLTIDEIQGALKTAGVYFDFIGMDCCIMSSLEVCCSLYDFCDYMILSEDFEPGLGWAYTGWMRALYNNTSISTPDLGKIIVDDMVQANAAYGADNDAILAVIDQSKMKVLYKAWTDFAYANEAALLGENYSRQVKARGKLHPRFGLFSSWLEEDNDSYNLSDYYITDIMAVAQTMNTAETAALSSALDNTLIYVGATSGDKEFTGISVTLPYGDSKFYADLKTIFTNCGIDKDYIAWLEKFVGSSNSNSFYDYDKWDDEWSGWDDYEDFFDWGSWLESDDDYGNDSYWSDDDWGWDDWDYDDSWNYWFDENDYDYDDWDYDDYDELDNWYWALDILGDWFW